MAASPRGVGAADVAEKVMAEVVVEVAQDGMQVIGPAHRIHRLDEKGVRLDPEVVGHAPDLPSGPGEEHALDALITEVLSVLSAGFVREALQVAVDQFP